MKKRNWKGICIGCMILAGLVLARCIATVARELYNGGNRWLHLLTRDFWTYAGIAAALIAIISGVMWYLDRKRGPADPV